jgi:hypothetical protein
MQRLLPASLLAAVADGIALGALTHALDLRMAQALGSIAPTGGDWTMSAYARGLSPRGDCRACGRGRSI